MKLVLFSDVHANLPALQALLADIDRLQADQIYCLGDLVGYAPFPNEVVAEIRKRKIPTIAGNHDEAIGLTLNEDRAQYQLKAGMSNGAISKTLTKQTVTSDNKAYLKALPRHMSLDFKFGEENIRLLLVHGSPRKINEYLFEEHDETDLLSLMTDAQAHIMAFGHTHKPFHRVMKDAQGNFRHAINTGSVGKPKDGNPDLCYVLIEFDDSVSLKSKDGVKISFIRRPYDVASIALAIEQSSYPNEYATMLKNAY